MAMKRLIPSMMLAAVLLAGGCKKGSGSAASSDTIPIGEFASLTGGTATFGTSSHEGTLLALDEINKTGILGKKIKLITEDDRSNADEAVSAVSKLINQDKVVAVLGEVASKRSLSGGSVCQAAGIPMLSPASTNPEVNKTGDFIFRICFTDDFQGRIGAQFAKDQGWKKVAILTDVANDYSKGLAKAFKENFPAGQIVTDENFKEGDKNFEAQLNKIKEAGPDAVYLPAYYTEVGLILAQARRLGLNVPFFGGDGWDSPTTLANPATQGSYYSDHYSPDSQRPETRKFVEAYRAKYGKDPDAMAVLGYDSMGVLAQAIKDAGKADPKAIRDALTKIKDFPGASGSITIDANRNASKPIVVLKIANNKTQIAKTYEPGK
jgi:branched-chain amino acid transport system substrate-binding protein